jgi:tetratricopeptide (TPR) repeat protein
MTVVAITLEQGLLKFRCEPNGLRVNRGVSDNDYDRFKQWSSSYLAALSRGSDPHTLLNIGREMREWLEGGQRCFESVLNAVDAPLLLEFCCGKDEPGGCAFFDTPWELLADEYGHWAERDSLIYCPVRRLGRRGDEIPPSPFKLTVVFMAAAPSGVGRPRFEDEEAAILKVAHDSGMDLVVEESGMLRLLRARVAEEKPDVVHISCHGTLRPQPALLLEDEFGDASLATAQELARELAGHRPRLLLLSVCQTTVTEDVVHSLVWPLVQRVAPAVLGWAGSVQDQEPKNFAGLLYRRLTDGEPLVQAVAHARLEMLLPGPRRPPAPIGGQSRDWHLARLYLGPSGGGVLATGEQSRRAERRGYACTVFLDRQRLEVPAAGPFEFVGRRRQLQSILGEFNKPHADRKAGVLIRGLRRQGKSSLAARVAERLEARACKAAVVRGCYDAPAILQAFTKIVDGSEVDAVVQAKLRAVEENPNSLETVLGNLLEGPCSRAKKDSAGIVSQRPVLLIIDEFEQALEGQQGGGRHRLKSSCVESIRATVKAFYHAATDSRLLITSRFAFTLVENGCDLADLLLDVPLPPMERYESEKRAAAKKRASEQQRSADLAGAETRRIERIVETSKGNPGLQEWLFRMALENPAACDRCLSDMSHFREKGEESADEGEVLQFLEKLALDSIVGLLSSAQKELLRASTLFLLPVPQPVMARLAKAAALSADSGDLARLAALGLWDVYENSLRGGGSAVAINPLVRPLAGILRKDEQAALAGLVASDLFNEWGGPKGSDRRCRLDDFELVRLALLARQAEVLLHTAQCALRWLEQQFAYRQAAEVGEAAIACIEQAGHAVPLDLRRATAENYERVRELQPALAHLESALQEIQRMTREGRPADTRNHAYLLVAHARLLVKVGRPDDALPEFEQARGLLKVDRDRAIRLGDIARLLAANGEMNDALKLHQESLACFEALGHERERATTLSDIARLLVAKGEVDEALKFRQERLAILESLGEKRSRAMRLAEIACLLAAKGEVDQALKFHREELVIYEALGDPEGIADTLWSIARIKLRRQHSPQALEHLAGSYSICLKLRNLVAICRVGMDFGQLLCGIGRLKEGLGVLERSRDGFIELGRPGDARYVQSIIQRYAEQTGH